MSDIEVTDNASEQRFEAWVGGELAGAAYYELADETITFTHTEVEDRFEGQGVGSALARGALDAVRADGGLRVVPRCSFIKGWIDRHEDYQDLLA